MHYAYAAHFPFDFKAEWLPISSFYHVSQKKAVIISFLTENAALILRHSEITNGLSVNWNQNNHIKQRKLKAQSKHTKLLQLIHRRLSGSLRRFRIILSFFSSSFTRFAILPLQTPIKTLHHNHRHKEHINPTQFIANHIKTIRNSNKLTNSTLTNQNSQSKRIGSEESHQWNSNNAVTSPAHTLNS